MLVTGWARGGYVAQSFSRQTLFSVENLSVHTILWNGMRTTPEAAALIRWAAALIR